MHDFVFLKAAALQKGSCLVSTATKAQLRLYLCAWNVPARTGAAPEQLTPQLHQGREHGANLSQTSPPDREAKHCCNNWADKHFTLFNYRSDSTKSSSLPNCLWITLFDVVLKRLMLQHTGPVTKHFAGLDLSRCQLTKSWSSSISCKDSYKQAVIMFSCFNALLTRYTTQD